MTLWNVSRPTWIFLLLLATTNTNASTTPTPSVGESSILGTHVEPNEETLNGPWNLPIFTCFTEYFYYYNRLLEYVSIVY